MYHFFDTANTGQNNVRKAEFILVYSSGIESIEAGKQGRSTDKQGGTLRPQSEIGGRSYPDSFLLPHSVLDFSACPDTKLPLDQIFPGQLT